MRPVKAKREIYARLGVQLRNNQRAFKAERIAPGAMGLYAFCVMDARAELQETDGFIAEEVALSAWGRPFNERSSQLDALCSVDLLRRVDGGFVVVRYAEHNDTRASVEKSKKDAAKRMRNVRRTSTEQTGVVQRTEGCCSVDVPISISTSLSGSDLRSPEGIQGEVEADEPSGVAPSMLRYRAAYCEGIARAKGLPYVWPTGPKAEWADGDLAVAIQTFGRSRSTGKALRGETLLGWISAAAEDLVRHTIKAKDDPKYWSHFDPRGLLRFLNQEVRTEEARHVG